ncbi:hypothetical protein PR048_015011 [Dryococelus australis]|uniref:Uncharacterized protein n=1 Tax=Dryococelus australis TaxID=614101 RepID=A0ABQ9HFS4_9NEOP|nr:hypothetical protein PR048_015011 [Dryococelus australis]
MSRNHDTCRLRHADHPDDDEELKKKCEEFSAKLQVTMAERDRLMQETKWPKGLALYRAYDTVILRAWGNTDYELYY